MFTVKFSRLAIYTFLVLATVPGRPVAALPDWYTNPTRYARFSYDNYIIAPAGGGSHDMARRNALGALVTRFGAVVRVNETIIESYREFAANGMTEWASELIDISAIEIVGGMNLIGAEVVDFWTDGNGNYFALAVMNRERTRHIYSERLRASLEIIDNLTNMSDAEKHSLVGVSRLRAAAVFADMSISYATVLDVLGVPQRGLRLGEDFRREADEIAATIPIGINVTGDRARRIQGAFAGVFSSLGFRTGGVNPRYVLDVYIHIAPTGETGGAYIGPMVFAQMDLTANLTDSQTGDILLPFYFRPWPPRRAGRTLTAAENVTISEAVIRIGSEFRDELSNYLSQLHPRR